MTNDASEPRRTHPDILRGHPRWGAKVKTDAEREQRRPTKVMYLCPVCQRHRYRRPERAAPKCTGGPRANHLAALMERP